jgi:hypothetical protein
MAYSGIQDRNNLSNVTTVDVTVREKLLWVPGAMSVSRTFQYQQFFVTGIPTIK